jgi:methyl-accepting chemotaxis protein
MKLEKWIHRKRIIILVCMLLFVLFLYLSFNSYELYVGASEGYKANSIDAIKQRMDTLFYEINDFPEDEGNDMLYLGKLNNLNKFINADENDRNFLKREVEADFTTFMEVNPVYYQLRYIDEFGVEIIKLYSINGEILIASYNELGNKRVRPYFEKTMQLAKGEVYVSPLDLNIDDSIIENRGTVENPEYVPVIRYAMPLFDDGSERKGIVIFNVYANRFLDDIRRLGGEGEFSFLVDNNGYYLAHPNRSKEYSFMFDGKESITSDYGKIGNEIIDDFKDTHLENEDYIFTFRHLYPTLGTFELYQGAKTLLGENPETEYYWTLVSVSNKAELHANIDNIRIGFVTFVLISALMISVIIILLFVILAVNGELEGGRK